MSDAQYCRHPSRMKPDSMDDPPWDINGKVTPVRGMSFKTPPSIINVCIANNTPIQNARVEKNLSCCIRDILNAL